ETLRVVKPEVIYCSISGFGQTGPWRSRPAFAHIINAVSGLMHLEQGDEPAPRASNLQAADVLAATHAATGILSALIRKSRTGKGAYFDVSMLEALIAADSVTYAAVLNGGEEYGSTRALCSATSSAIRLSASRTCFARASSTRRSTMRMPKPVAPRPRRIREAGRRRRGAQPPYVDSRAQWRCGRVARAWRSPRAR